MLAPALFALAAASPDHTYSGIAPGTVTSRASFVTLADLDGDGAQDLVVLEGVLQVPRTGTLVWWRNTGPRIFAVAGTWPFDPIVSYRVGALSAADLDADGDDDLLVGHDDGLTVVTFDEGVPAAIVVYPLLPTTAIATGDVNGDGALDVVTVATHDEAVLLVGDGTGGLTVTQRVPIVAVDDNDAALGDLTGDGQLDLVVSSGRGGLPAAVVYAGDGVGFGDRTELWLPDLPFTIPDSVAVGDLDGDGRNDVALGTGGNGDNATPWWFGHDPAGGWTAPNPLVAYDIPCDLDIHDADANGRDDLVMAHCGWDAVGVFHQRTDGLEGETVYGLFGSPIGWGPDDTAYGELDGDGCPDIATVDAEDFGLLVLFGEQCGFDDVDLDGVEDGYDLCPSVADAGQEDGDGDRIGDACDPCPTDAGDASDRDHDGFGDLCDRCPYDADDGADRDADGLGDACDPCPELAQATGDADGDEIGDACDPCPDGVCPAAPRSPPPSCGCGAVTPGSSAGVVLALIGIRQRRRTSPNGCNTAVAARSPAFGT